MPRKKRITLIILPIVLLICILAIVLILLYFKTDIFQSNKMLFAKYMGQNAQNIEETLKTLTEEDNGKLDESKHTDKTQIKLNYTENIGTSLENTKNSINGLKLNIDGQSDFENEYNYKNVTLMDQDNKVMQVEYIQKDNRYGIRFTNLIKQFILVENSGIRNLAQKFGYSEADLNNIPDEIKNENYKITFSDEEKQVLGNKYLNLIGDDFSEDRFIKEKDQTIKINNENLNVNKYTLKINKEELNSTYIKILEELKQDEIILNKIVTLQENINKFMLLNNSEKNIKEQFIDFLNKEIEKLNETTIKQDEIEINVYEYNRNTVRTEIKSTEDVIEFDCVLSEESSYSRN